MNLPPWLTKGVQYLQARALWAAVFAFVAILFRLSLPAPPPRTAEGVAAMLGAAVGGEVRPDDFVWEERGSFLSDAFLGRRVLFLARRPSGAAGANADLYRARVRLTRAGRPVAMRLLRNLTESPLGDDRDLIAHGHHAAYVSVADGVVQGITLLDLAGDAADRRAQTRRERLGAAIEAWFGAGSTDGIGRTEITFSSASASAAAPAAAPASGAGSAAPAAASGAGSAAAPRRPGPAQAAPSEAKIELAGDLLVMALGKEALPAALDLRDGSLNTGARNVFGARAQRIPHFSRPLGDVAVDVLQDFAGPVPARALRAVLGSPQRAAPPVSPEVFPGRAPPPALPSVDGWPPAPLSPRVQPPLPGEGVWGPPAVAVQAGPEGAPSALFETAIRPSPAHPEALVRLVALDLRQIDLRLEAGIGWPRSASGLRGVGRIPADAPAVAAFTAGPAAPVASASAAPSPGFAVDRRIFQAPVAGLGTIAIHGDGHLAFGAWSAAEGALPAEIASIAQTPDPILGGDGHARFPLDSGAVRAERSALCRLGSGQILYAWGGDLSVATLAEALAMAGCTYAVPLAASPAPVGFAYLHADPGAGRLQALPLAPEMSIPRADLLGGSPNAFFYAVRRDTRPAAPLPSAEARAGDASAPDTGWTPDVGQQPAPAWIPSIYTAVVTNLGAQVHLTSFAPGRVAFRIRAGGKEPATKAASALPGALSEAEQGRALAAIGLGAGRKRGARGIAIEGAVGYAFKGDSAGILVIDKGKIAITSAAGFSLPPGADATELPLTADEGKLRPEAREVGSMRPRAVACVLDDGTFVVGSTTFDSDEAGTTSLLDLGCARVVALDRGSHHAAFLHRAGTEMPPGARYEASALYAVDTPLTGRARQIGGD